MADENEQSGSSGEASSDFEPTPLSSVFGGTSETHAEEKSASEHEEPDKPEKEEASQKLPESNSSSDDDEKSSKSEKQDEKADDKSKDAAEKEKPSKPSDKKEDKPSDKWDTDENPFKKRYSDTHASWNKEHQENLQLRTAYQQQQEQLTRLQKMVDGTYDPEKDGPKQVSHEDVASRALSVGKVMASKNAAISQFGLEKVNSEITEFNSLFENNPGINAAVLQAESPIHKVFEIMENHRFQTKYGNTPADIHKNIRAEAEKELRDSIRKEITEELLAKADKKKNHPSFSSSRGSNGVKDGAKPNRSGPTPLKEVFGR